MALADANPVAFILIGFLSIVATRLWIIGICQKLGIHSADTLLETLTAFGVTAAVLGGIYALLMVLPATYAQYLAPSLFGGVTALMFIYADRDTENTADAPTA